jgi:hypothetical protein
VWRFVAANLYAGGAAFASLASPPTTWTAAPSIDHAFKTYVVEQSGFAFTGFLSPVENPPTFNTVHAGSAVPVKFSLAGDQGLNILAAGSPASQNIACDDTAPINPLEETVTAGGSGLQYDALTDVYTYVWKTQKSWAGTCRQLVVTLSDGTDHVANFQFN